MTNDNQISISTFLKVNILHVQYFLSVRQWNIFIIEKEKFYTSNLYDFLSVISQWHSIKYKIYHNFRNVLPQQVQWFVAVANFFHMKKKEFMMQN